jgi:hypothetical protein
MVDSNQLLADLNMAAPPAMSTWEVGARALDRALQAYPGHRLFTILAIDWTRRKNQRVYSSQPASYPPGGAKPLVSSSDFYQEVILGGRARFCADREACQRAFPIRLDGATVGSLNLLHRRGWYDREMLPPLMLFADYAAALLVRHPPGAQT